MAVTTTVGGTTSGNCATGSKKAAIAPASVISIERTEAKIGRSIKKCENFILVVSSSNRIFRIADHVTDFAGTILPGRLAWVCSRRERPIPGVEDLRRNRPCYLPAESLSSLDADVRSHPR